MKGLDRNIFKISRLRMFINFRWNLISRNFLPLRYVSMLGKKLEIEPRIS